MNSFRQLIKETFSSEMKRLNFTLFRSNYWYKLENQLIYTFGFFQGTIDFDISPLFFCFMPGEHSMNWESLIPYEARIESTNRYYNYKRGTEDSSDYSEFLRNLYNTYVKSSLENCNDVESALDLALKRTNERFPPDAYENRIATYGYITALPKPIIPVSCSPDLERLYLYRKEYSLLESILLKLIIGYYEHNLNQLLTSVRALKDPDAPHWHADVAKITEEILIERYLDFDIYKEILSQLERRDEKALQQYVEDERIKTVRKIRDFWPSTCKLPEWVN